MLQGRSHSGRCSLSHVSIEPASFSQKGENESEHNVKISSLASRKQACFETMITCRGVAVGESSIVKPYERYCVWSLPWQNTNFQIFTVTFGSADKTNHKMIHTQDFCYDSGFKQTSIRWCSFAHHYRVMSVLPLLYQKHATEFLASSWVVRS